MKIKIQFFATALGVLISFFAASQNTTQPVAGFEGIAVSYSIEIKTKKNNTGISETYNGGSKTVFLSPGKARIRLMSLMRIESTYFLDNADSTIQVYMIKESGRSGFNRKMSDKEWLQFNQKYDSLHCELIASETTNILGYACKKAIIRLRDGRTITAYYTEELPAIKSFYEPAFACLPGLVLQYQYVYKTSSAVYTAVSVLKEKINPDIFLPKKHGIREVRY